MAIWTVQVISKFWHILKGELAGSDDELKRIEGLGPGSAIN